MAVKILIMPMTHYLLPYSYSKMQLIIKKGYFGAANKFQKTIKHASSQTFTQPLKRTLKQRNLGNGILTYGAAFYSNATHKMHMVGFDVGFWKYIFKTVL
jgi:hypothetical protein